MTTDIRSHWPISIMSSLAAVFNMLLPLFLVRVLTPEEIGAFKIFFLYLTLIPGFALTLGLINGLAYWAGKGEAGRRAIAATALLTAGAAFLFFALVLCLQGWTVRVFGWQASHALIFAFAVLGVVASQFFEEAAICTGRIWTGALFYSGFEILRTAAMVAAAFLTRSLAAVFLTHAALSLLKAILGYAFGLRLKLCGWVADGETYRALVRYALPVSLAGLLAIPLVFADQLILSAYVSHAEFAVYAIGCLSIPPLFLLEQAVTRVLIPQMSEAFNTGRFAHAAELHKKAVEELALLMLPAVAGMIVFAEPIIEILFTPQYSAAAKYLRIFAFNYLLLILPYDSVPRAKGQGAWILRTFAAFSAGAVLLCLGLTIAWGPFGALAGILSAKAAMRLYGLRYVRRSTAWQLAEFLPGAAILRCAVVSAALSGLALAAGILFENRHLWFFVCAPIFALLYFAALIAWKKAPAAKGPPAVLMLTQFLRVGGLERMVLMLAERLQARRRVAVFSYDGLKLAGHAGLIPEFQRRGISVEAHQKGRGFAPCIVFKLIRKIVREEITVVHSHDLGALIYGVCAKLFAPVRIRLVHTQHSFVHLQKKRRYRLYERIFCRMADELTVVSEENRRIYSELGCPPGRIRLVENGVEIPDGPTTRSARPARRRALFERLGGHPLLPQLQEYASAVWILNMARVHPVKGQRRAVNLWNALDPRVRGRCVLIFIGPTEVEDELRRLREAISAAADARRIILWGESCTPQDWLSAGDIYLSCSAWEGLPLAPLEALACGLPVVLSNAAGHRFLESFGAQFPAEDSAQGAAAVTAAIASLAEPDQDEAAEARAAWVREHHSAQAMTLKYEALYG